AISKGPFIYCIEEADNGKDLQMLSISQNSTLRYENGYILADGFREEPDKELYSEYKKSKRKSCTLKFIPYYLWGNRGENEMSVYIRITE
ncbi:MAG: glycoside hydrolase family 127 protein, partial [Eubacterium sp.]